VVRLQGVVVGHRDDFEAMGRAIEGHALRPVVDRVFGFDEAPAAFEHVAAGAHFGKVCIRVG
jgi:NADPH:quinone reductase-like Zn-dependent oxidoreductase